jgi:hypothetical protein
MNLHYKIIFILLILDLNSANAQLIDNNLNIYLGYSNNFMLGSGITNENGFIAPSLYSNMHKSNSYSIKGIFKYKKNLSLGLGFNINSMNNWNMVDYDNYNNSKIFSISFTPLIQLHLPNTNRGLLNRLKIFIEFDPVIGFSNLSLEQPLFDIQSNSGSNIKAPDKGTDFFAGFEFAGGFEFKICNAIGIFGDYGYKNCWTSSKFFNDKRFSNTFVEYGLYLRFYKNKRFYYE